MKIKKLDVSMKHKEETKDVDRYAQLEAEAIDLIRQIIAAVNAKDRDLAWEIAQKMQVIDTESKLLLAKYRYRWLR